MIVYSQVAPQIELLLDKAILSCKYKVEAISMASLVFARTEPGLDPQERQRLSGPAIRTFLNIADTWGLALNEQRALLGWPSESGFYKYKAGDVAALPHDMLTRISLAIGIHQALQTLYPEPGLAARWVKLPNSNPLFGGTTPIDFMTKGGMDGLWQVRRLLESRLHG
jgi:hypothetical protein